jgi:5-methylcytosine-specific restriction endonuclease McrA
MGSVESRAYHRAWYQRNKEKRIRQVAEWKVAHPEDAKRHATTPKAKERHRLSQQKRLSDPQRRAERNEYMRIRQSAYEPQWRAANPEKAKARARRAELRRKARSANAPGTVTEEQLQARIDFYGRRCYLPWCGHCDWDALDPFDQTIDHVIPLSQGGTGWPANLRPACRPCNAKKYAKALDMALAA